MIYKVVLVSGVQHTYSFVCIHTHCCCLVTKSCLTFCVPMGYSPPGSCGMEIPCPWGFLGKNTGVGFHFLLQGILVTHGSNMCLLHWQVDSLPLSCQGSPIYTYTYIYIFFFQILFYYRLLQDIEYISLCYTVCKWCIMAHTSTHAKLVYNHTQLSG